MLGGAVTVGTGSGKGAFLSPGKGQDTAVLILLNALTFNADGGYRCGLNSDTASSDEVFVSGITINSGAQFLSADAGASALTPGIDCYPGIVVSDKAEKTITVRIDIARRHRRYEKIVRSSSTVHAHDENNDAHEGDVVRVVESRPLSRTKRWALVDVLERAR